MARLAFEASIVAKVLAKFSPQEIDGMQLVLDTEKRKVTLEIVGLAEARALLEYYGALSRWCRKKDIIEWAGALILIIEAERGE